MGSKSALVVDDSYTMRNMVSLALKDAAFEVVEAGDGKEALDAIEGKEIDVIITDINMTHRHSKYNVVDLCTISVHNHV